MTSDEWFENMNKDGTWVDMVEFVPKIFMKR